jgi:nucleoid-associated protein YgaU
VSSGIARPYLDGDQEANGAPSGGGIARSGGLCLMGREEDAMGLIDFVVNAGKKLFGAGDAAAAPTSDPDVLSKRAGALEAEVKSLGLPVDDLKIKVAEHTAYVKGRVKTQADREKVVLAVGNVEGIAKVEDRLEVTNPEPEARYYTVVKGDTLSKIAKEQYRDANKYPAIFEANKPMLTHPDKIYPGQVLRIPPQ